MAHKRPQPTSHFSCALCFKSKIKCDKGDPCANCVRRRVDCVPSSVETTDRKRKQRFPEAELLNRIKKYENALLTYGADLEAIRASDKGIVNNDAGDKANSDGTLSSNNSIQPPPYNPYHEVDQMMLGALGEGEIGTSAISTSTTTTATTSNNTTTVNALPPQSNFLFSFLDQTFENDGSAMFFAVDLKNTPEHPAPFDIFKLWQVYYDNIHPLNKVIHAPTFQRKISSYGSHLPLAPASDQALFFAVYVAAISSLSAEECEAMFFSTKKSLVEQYQLGTQLWLRRAGLWRTSELTVLQAFVLFLSTLHNEVDPRTLASFTAVSERIARRMGLHRKMLHGTPVEQEMRKRLWWELILLDSRTAEKGGMGSSLMTATWSNVGMPSERSDTDIEGLDGAKYQGSSQPASEMLFFLIRSEAALFLATLRYKQSIPEHDTWSEFATLQMSTRRKLEAINEFELKIKSKYLCLCDERLANHRMTISVAKIIISRMRMSTHIVEEGCREESLKHPVQKQLLIECVICLEETNKIRSDISLQRFQWFIHQHMPIFALIHALRLLQTRITGSLSDRAWQAIQSFLEKGMKLQIDSLILRAWRSRKEGSFGGGGGGGGSEEEPPFIKAIDARQATTPFTPSQGAENSHQNNLWMPSNTNLLRSSSDYISLLSEMSSSTDFDFDWSGWLNEAS